MRAGGDGRRQRVANLTDVLHRFVGAAFTIEPASPESNIAQPVVFGRFAFLVLLAECDVLLGAIRAVVVTQTTLLHDLIAREPAPFVYLITEALANFFVVGIELEDPLQMVIPEIGELLPFAPLGHQACHNVQRYFCSMRCIKVRFQKMPP